MTDYFSRALGTGDTMEATPVETGDVTSEQYRRMTDDQKKAYRSGRSSPKPQEPSAQGDYFSRALGTGTNAQPATAPNSGPVDPNATPDAPTWVGRRIQDVMGKQDQRYKDLPVFRPDTAGFDAVGKGTYAAGAIAGNTDQGMADLIAKQLGQRHIKTELDANGYPIVHYYDDQGLSQKAYVNKPGLDFQDVGRAVAGALPYVATGGLAGSALKGAGAVVNAVGQGATAGATNLATQAIARPATGSDQGIDPSEAAITTVAGGAAPAISSAAGAIWRRLVTVPSLYDKAAGTLTPKGMAAAQSAGLKPNEITPDIAKTFADALSKTKDEAQAAIQSTTSAYGIPVSKGQITKDPYLLTQEEAMRRRLFGEQAQGVMQSFDEQQSQAIKNAALGGGQGSKPGIATSINPDRNPGFAPNDANPATLGESVREGVQSAREGAKIAENKAWDSVPKMAPTKDALDLLPDHISAAVGQRVVDESTPTAARMGKALDNFTTGKTPESVASVFKTQPVQDVDRMRRVLLSMRGGAQTPEDRAAAKAVYDGFNSWIDAAAEKNLLAGDVNMAAQLKVARGFTKEIHDIFEPSIAGKATPAAGRIKQVLDGADTPEGVVQSLLGSQGSKTVTQGGVGALRNIKQALDKYAEPDTARQTWNDIRLAYWVRLVQGKNGELVGPTAMMNNIKTAFANQQSALETLYQPGELVRMKQFLRALEAVSYKPPNASGSGYSATQLMGGPLGKLFEAFGLNTKIAQTAMEYTGVGNAMGAATARGAVSPAIREVNPNLAGPIVGATNALARGDRPQP